MTTLDKMFDYDEACAFIDDLARLGSRPGLERIRRLCAFLGDPQEDLRFIHIAGTNGKGSTACMISSVLAEAGMKVGMYTSPAVCGIRDHYRINGELISESEYAACVSRVANANDELIAETGESATQFEIETAVAFVFFGKNNCDAVVLECGMGGRDDATNIVRNKICCVLTSISYDHMQYLGDTLTEIAGVKSGIINSGGCVIALDSGSEVTEVIRKRCELTGSSLYLVDPDEATSVAAFPLGQMVSYGEMSDVIICLLGSFQKENAALAIKTLSVIADNDLIEGFVITDDIIRQGMKKAKWPYRFECISSHPPVFTDGAHNADAAVKLAGSVKQYLPGYRIILMLGVFADKEYDKVLKVMSDVADCIITLQTPGNKRALPAAQLAKSAAQYFDDVRTCGSIEEAYETAAGIAESYSKAGQKAAVVACGSLSYLHELTVTVLEKKN